MSRRRNRRWTPGKGFTKVFDWGTEAGWIRAEKDGCTVALYSTQYHWCEDFTNRCPHYRQREYSEAWLIALPRGSRQYDELLNKPHRIIRAATEHGHSDDPRFSATIVSYRHVGPASHGCEKRHGLRLRSRHSQSFRRINCNSLTSMRLREAMRPRWKERLLIDELDNARWEAELGKD